jgi:hypothetical protein
MTKKDATNLMYNALDSAGFIEDKIQDDKEFLIFKSENSEDYMVCKFDGEDGYISDLFHTINECYDWINQELL